MSRTSALPEKKNQKRVNPASTTQSGKAIIYRDSAIGTFISRARPSGTTSTTAADPAPPFDHARTTKQAELERAVVAHLRALRTLGRTEINTLEIADALSIPLSDIHQILDRLKKKGVRLL